MQINPTKPQYDMLTSRAPVNLFLGGQGSGKSHCAGLVSAYMVSCFPMQRGIIGANTYGQLSRSTLFRIREVWRGLGMEEYTQHTRHGCYVIGRRPPPHFITTGHNYDSYKNIISFANGAVIYAVSLSNYRSLDGIEATWAVLDETKDTREEAVKQVITGRLRQRGLYVRSDGELVAQYMRQADNTYACCTVDKSCTSFNPLYIFTSPANVPWLNEWFGLDDHEAEIRESIFSAETYYTGTESNKYAVISSTHHNRENLPENYIANQQANLPTHLQDMLIYGCPFSKAGGEFYKSFDRVRHVSTCTYDASLPLHVSLDENVHPYLPAGIFQLRGKRLAMIDEIAAADPYNTIDHVCRELTRRYQGHSAGLFIYGDATSRRSDVKLPKGYDFYRLAENGLAQFKPRRCVSDRNPAVAMRGNFINMVLEREFRGCSLRIDPRCKKTITDFTMTRQNADGSKNKATVTDPITKITSQPYGHFTDLADYIMCHIWHADYNAYLHGNKENGTTLTAAGSHMKV